MSKCNIIHGIFDLVKVFRLLIHSHSLARDANCTWGFNAGNLPMKLYEAKKCFGHSFTFDAPTV